jgi:hypothetical protein
LAAGIPGQQRHYNVTKVEQTSCKQAKDRVELSRDEAMLRQLYFAKPDDLLALIAQRTGLTIKRATLKVWRKAVPLVLPMSCEQADKWIDDVMKERRERREKAWRRRMERATQDHLS